MKTTNNFIEPQYNVQDDSIIMLDDVKKNYGYIKYARYAYKKGWKRTKLRKQYIRFIHIYKWISIFYKNYLSFFFKQLLRSSFFKLQVLSKFKTKRTFFLQNEFWFEFFHFLPKSITWLYLSNFNMYNSNDNQLTNNLGVFFLIKSFDVTLVNEGLDYLDQFLTEFPLIFKSIGVSPSIVEKTNNYVDFEGNLFFCLNIYILLEIYKTLINLNYNVIYKYI